MSKIQKTDHFYLVDGSGYIFRAYYALPPLTRKSDGLPTGAVSGFCSMLFKLLEDSKSNQNLQKPTHFAVIFDSSRKTFRNEIYSDYKANRSEAPDDLAPQFEYIRKSVLAFNLPSVELMNFEADDLIATYVDKILSQGAKVTIVSSDKDFLQLVDDTVEVYAPIKKKTFTKSNVIDEIKVLPQNYNLVKALLGDSSDNLPGVKGLGIKTILSEWKSFTYDPNASLQDVWDHCETQMELKKPKKIFAKILHSFDKVVDNFAMMDLHQTQLDESEIDYVTEVMKSPVPDLQTGAFLHLLDQDKIEGITKNTDTWLENFRGLTTVS